MDSPLAAALMDLPSVIVVVLDRHGVITRVNEACRRFARENCAPELAGHSVGLHYLAVCRQAIEAPYGESARDVVEGIQAVLAGTLPHFSLEYPSHSPIEYRAFRLDVVPVAGGGAVIAQTQLMAFRRSETRTQGLTGATPPAVTGLGDESTPARARQPSAQPPLASRTQCPRQILPDTGELTSAASELPACFTGSLEALAEPAAIYGAAGRALRVNRAWAELFALDRDPTYFSLPYAEQARALCLRTSATEQPFAAEELPIARALRGEALVGSRAVDVRVRALDGRELELNITAAPLRDGGGQIVGAATVYRDVTERLEHERESIRKIDLVAHELRHPLAIVRMASGLLSQGATPSDPAQPGTLKLGKLRELLEFVDHGVAEMERLVQDLVDAAQMESGAPELQVAPTDLSALIEQVSEEMRRLRGQAIHVAAPQRRVMAPVDKIRIVQVLTNLLTNAYKYSPANTVAHVRLRRRDGTARVEVRNEGSLIPTEAQAHVFERFYRVPDMKVRQGPNTGLGQGLYLCRQIVQSHGGRIGVESTAERGTTFWFTLPLGEKARSGSQENQPGSK